MLNVNLRVRCGSEYSESFQTDTGGPQGDSSSANEFTFYLAKALCKYYTERRASYVLTEHNYNINANKLNLPELEDHTYNKKDTENLDIDMQYADDISELNTDTRKIEHLKKNLPNTLKERDLSVNLTKTEEYTFTSKNTKWKACKHLGSFIDTEKDIANRKGKAIESANSVEIFENKKLSVATKMSAFDIYVGYVFLYNSELWTTTESLNKKIDSLHRRLLRKYVLNIKYPKIIKNEEVYRRTKAIPWSVVIGQRRLTWLGHVIRLNEQTPARQALEYAMQSYKKKKGRPKMTWLKLVENQLKDIVTFDQMFLFAQDRSEWNKIVNTWLQDVTLVTNTVL